MGIPDNIGPFVIRGEIGRGGMGVVYLARDLELDRAVAVKALPSLVAQDSVWLDRMIREAKALGRLNHPNVAQIYSMETVDQSRFLVLEFVPGESLAERLGSIRLGIPETLRICQQVAMALEAVHKRGMVHRDLKPANIRITPDGTVKVVDFGLAVCRPRAETRPTVNAASDRTTVEPSRPRHGITCEQGIAGTPGYMSPEQARGQPVDKRSDIFSYGCILFECLSSERPFRGNNASEIMEATLLDEPTWSSLPPGIPGPILELLPRCLEKELGRRLSDMASARIAISSSLVSDSEAETTRTERKPTPSNLPEELTSFVGREDQVGRLKAGLVRARFITVTGAGGCGKTRLAIRVARESLERFGDGVWLVELASIVDPARVVPAFCSVLATHDRFEGDALRGLTAALKDRRLLLVIDNCEHVLGRCRQLVHTLLRECPNLAVLATSREALGLPGEFVYSLPSLTVPGLDEPPEPRELMQYESVQLFVERARLTRHDFELTKTNTLTVARICRRLDGIPLAIELAAVRLRVLTVDQLESMLGERFRLLTGGSEMVIARHRTLRATLDWSYESLCDEESRILRALSVFNGGWTLESAKAVCAPEMDEFQFVDLLTQLVGKSLVLIEETGGDGDAPEVRYSMHQSMRDYGQEKMAGAEVVAARDRHLDYFLALAERSGAQVDRETWQHRMAIEQDNLNEALRWSLATDDGTKRDLRLAKALRRLAKSGTGQIERPPGRQPSRPPDGPDAP